MRPRFLLVLALALPLFGAGSAKRPITHKDYDSWRSIGSPTLSRDGKWLAYGLFPQAGNGEFVVRELASGKERRENAGELPPPPEPDPDEPPQENPRPRAIRIYFTADGKFAVATTFPTRQAVAAARKARKKPEEMPNPGLLVVPLAGGDVIRIDSVRSVQVAEKGDGWFAYLKEPAGAAPPADESAEEPESRPRERTTAAGELTLMRAGVATRTFPDVSEFALAKDGRTLVFAVSSKASEHNGAFAVTPGTEGAPAPVLAGNGRYVKLTWNRDQDRLALLSDREDSAARRPKLRLYLWERTSGTAAKEAVAASSEGMRADWEISDRGALTFSRDGSRLFFQTTPSRPPRAALPPAEERVVADLWHWKDPLIQPMQRVRAAAERVRAYRAVYHVASGKVVPLASIAMATTNPSDDGLLAIGAEEGAYESRVDFDGRFADYYLIDTVSGTRRLVAERLRGGGGPPGAGSAVSFSPDGRHLLYYCDGHWFAAPVTSGPAVNLTSGLSVKFADEEDDTPDPATSYGNAGWSMDGKWVLLNDRYDVWRVSPDGKIASNLTAGIGRRDRVVFRVVRQQEEDDQENRGHDPAKPLLLSAVNDRTRASAFYRTTIGVEKAPEKLIERNAALRFVAKAKDADVVLITATTFGEQPDLHVTDMSFRKLEKVTDANPQQSEFLWGSAELIHFRNTDGEPLQAALFKPEGFDATKKYPLMVYIYERLSNQLHSFAAPAPGTSVNRSYYVSNGYLFLMPDISYRVGYPGKSALHSVMPAIQAVVDLGIVNEDAIGIQGHSWGGYQIAYMVTQTKRFKAAVAGAPVGNMTSAYNGIRWGTGLPRQFQYEQTQSRIGGSLWETPLRFIENSPVFMADRVTTPLLMIHDDQDDAVPWYQGIELFLSLRRNGKEAYLINYNGERHGLRRRPNQKDWTVRMQQFFDHHLKRAPKPDWMDRGVPYLERDQEKLRYQ
jgi:dipeptidyl aminopeptidase/acylaminoacyl peptidase